MLGLSQEPPHILNMLWTPSKLLTLLTVYKFTDIVVTTHCLRNDKKKKKTLFVQNRCSFPTIGCIHRQGPVDAG